MGPKTLMVDFQWMLPRGAWGRGVCEHLLLVGFCRLRFLGGGGVLPVVF